MTVNEVITECITYPYSKEAYDIQQEVYEASLISQALESICFQENNEEMITESGVEDSFIAFTEGKKKQMFNSFSAKKGGVWRKIVNGLKGLITKITNFFTTLTDKFTGQEMKARVIRKFIATAPNANGIGEKIRNEFKEAVSKAAEKGADSEKGTISVRGLQDAIANANIQQPYSMNFGNFSSVFQDGLKKLLSAALSPTKVKVPSAIIPSGKGKPSNTFVSADTLSRYVDRFQMGKGELSSLISQFRTDATNAVSNGVEISVAGNSLKRATALLKKSKKRLEKAGEYITTKALNKNDEAQSQSKSSDPSKYDENRKVLNDANEAYTGLVTMIGWTMSVYKAFNGLRDQVIKKLYKYVSKKGKKARKESEAEDKKLGIEKNRYAESAFDDLLDYDDDYSESYDEDFDDSEFADMFD